MPNTPEQKVSALETELDTLVVTPAQYTVGGEQINRQRVEILQSEIARNSSKRLAQSGNRSLVRLMSE